MRLLQSAARYLRGNQVVLIATLIALASCTSSKLPAEPSRRTDPTDSPAAPVDSGPVDGGAGAQPASTQDPAVTPASTGQTRFEACEEASGRVERTEYSSQLLGEYIPVLVYLPPCYPDRGEYPVLFLLHGKPQDEKHWTILGVDKFVDERIKTGELAELVLVMPEQPEPLFSQTDGGPGSYEGEFISALVPFIESRYAISTRPEARSIAGISRGGVWALEIAFTHPESFDGVGGLSPALEVNDARPAYDPIELAGSKEELPKHIFLASGDVDSAAADTQRLHALLTERGAAHRYTTVPGGHEGATWARLIGEMLAYLTSQW